MNSLKRSIIMILILNTTLFSKTIVTYFSNKDEVNGNMSYGFKLLRLSLEKTRENYGDFTLVKTPKMNKKRAILTLRANSLENFIIKLSNTKQMMDEFTYIPFPVDRGIVGYRVAFLSSKLESQLEKVNTLDSLKALNIIQGRGWLDIDILKYNGFNVKAINSIESAINMISLNRADLFFRGINEVLDEYKGFKDIKNITYDKTFILYYPLPRFLYTNKLNKNIMIRIEEGLKLAYKDGSLDKLFNEYYQKSIDFLELNKRKLYKLENPYLEEMDTSYEKYNFDPLQ